MIVVKTFWSSESTFRKFYSSTKYSLVIIKYFTKKPLNILEFKKYGVKALRQKNKHQKKRIKKTEIISFGY